MDPTSAVRGTAGATATADASSGVDAVSDEDVELLESAPMMAPSGNLAIDVMLLLERSMAGRQKQVDSARDAAEKAQRAAEDAQVEKMREGARDSFAQAISSAAFSMAASGAQVASGCIQIEAGKLQYKGARANDPKVSQSYSALATRASAYAKVWDGVGTAANATGTAVSAAWGKAAKNDEASAKDLEHVAARAGRQVAAVGERSREMGEMIDKTLQRLEQLVETENQTKLALIQRM
ncbi:MAG: hypothetical protein JST00_40155 [Deltaproteobacteria bacterium]|nr:hypothetical protein [Deltaproteobacteria bacterium]